MVVQDRFEVVNPRATAVITSNLASEKYIVVKNHVRELCSNAQIEPIVENKIKHVNLQDTNQTEIKGKKQKRKEADEQNSTACKISKTDLEELRHVYKRCKSVLKNIENKYGHLLNFCNEAEVNPSDSEEYDLVGECECDRNTRIFFDDDGKQIVKEFEEHICLKKCKGKQISHIENPNIQIEYEEELLQLNELPDTLNELGNILKDPKIDDQLRNKVIHKIKGLRYEYVNEVKFNKQKLVEKLKANSEDMLNFEGTNLSKLSGYPT